MGRYSALYADERLDSTAALTVSSSRPIGKSMNLEGSAGIKKRRMNTIQRAYCHLGERLYVNMLFTSSITAAAEVRLRVWRRKAQILVKATPPYRQAAF